MSDVQDIHGAIPQPKGVALLRDEAGNYAIKAVQATDPAVRRMAQEREREFDAIADELLRLRSAPGETGASAPTRTSERGLSYHDGTEALREALEEIAEHSPGEHHGLFNSYECGICESMLEVARRALSQHVGGEG